MRLETKTVSIWGFLFDKIKEWFYRHYLNYRVRILCLNYLVCHPFAKMSLWRNCCNTSVFVSGLGLCLQFNSASFVYWLKMWRSWMMMQVVYLRARKSWMMCLSTSTYCSVYITTMFHLFWWMFTHVSQMPWTSNYAIFGISSSFVNYRRLHFTVPMSLCLPSWLL